MMLDSLERQVYKEISRMARHNAYVEFKKKKRNWVFVGFLAAILIFLFYLLSLISESSEFVMGPAFFGVNFMVMYLSIILGTFVFISSRPEMDFLFPTPLDRDTI